VDTQTYAVAAKIPVGRHPAHVVLTRDGRHAYVTNGGDNTVGVVDVQAGNMVATIPVGDYPHGLRISPDGREAYVANLKAGSVSVLDTVTMKEVARLPVGKAPAQTGFAPDGAVVSLSGDDRVALIDRASRKVVSKVAFGSGPIQVHGAAMDAGCWSRTRARGSAPVQR
jgi:YVTN family beta-propeller protein